MNRREMKGRRRIEKNREIFTKKKTYLLQSDTQRIWLDSLTNPIKHQIQTQSQCMPLIIYSKLMVYVCVLNGTIQYRYK